MVQLHHNQDRELFRQLKGTPLGSSFIVNTLAPASNPCSLFSVILDDLDLNQKNT